MVRRFSSEGLVVGVGLLSLGILALLAREGRVDFLTTLHTWWPATFILWGLAELLNTFIARSGSSQ